MPIHPPRKSENDQYREQADRFSTMLNDWVKDKNPHARGMHYPDYSCCYPELRVPLKEKAAFRKAIADLDEPVLDRLKRQFDEALCGRVSSGETEGEGD